jgi:hypothetical protein
MAFNVHKNDFNKIKLPADAISEDRGLRNCGTPYLVVADTEDASYWKNDRTGIAYKFDSMLIELEDAQGNVIEAPGIAVSFPYQSDARGFVIDWRQVVSGGQLAQGCYRVIVNWELGGNSGAFYYGSFNLLSYSFFNVQKTVRLFVVLNDLVRKQGINYKDSGFGTTIRFKGQFGYMQPNYDTENIVYTNRTREKVRNEALRTYELRSNYLLSCQTRMIDEEYLLTANQIYVTDHNANNHVQSYFDFPVILSEDESPSFEYNEGIYAKVSASFKEKVAVSESKYDGNISGSANVILELPTVVTTTPSCPDATIENSNASYTDSVVSGGALVLPDITVTDSDGSTYTQPSVENVVCTLSPDTSLEVNGTPEGTFAAGSTIEVNITDGVNPVTPNDVTVVGDVVTIEVPAATPAPVGATLMKTGQTTSYRTGDDGDIEAGRATDFFTLASNNPFGNTNRFTDELGGSTYTNNIVIDWSTYNGATVLGYYFDKTTRTWNNFVDWGIALSVGTFTSGWRGANATEIHNLFNYELNEFINYSPFNYAADGNNLWTSTTAKVNTATAYFFNNTTTQSLARGAKTSAIYCMATRTFTVTGTTLT